MAIIYASDRAMSAPPANAPFAPGRASYRATFSLGDMDDVVGTQTATWENLDIGTWEGNAGLAGVANGSLVPKGGTGFVGLPILGQNGCHATWQVRKLPTANVFYIDLFRNFPSSSASYRASITATGNMRLLVRASAADSGNPVSPYFSVADGDYVGVRWVRGVLTLLLNRIPLIHVKTDAVAPVGMAGVSWSAGATGFELDNPEIDVY